MPDPVAHSVAVDLGLGPDRLVDLMVLQWHTPTAHPTNNLKISPDLRTSRGDALSSFSQCLSDLFPLEPSSRPLFIIAPELSLPTCCIAQAQSLVESLHRPAVFIAGLEYMQWNEYLSLLDTVEVPDAVRWRANGGEGRVVNVVSIWIREQGGTVRRFVQRKRNPAHPEVAGFAAGQDILVFTSRDQNPGSRLNFSAQVCADFTSPACVREFRRAALRANQPPVSLDVTFVVQHNESDEPHQFRQGSSAYFETPDGMIDTSNGCILFVNNANPLPGKSVLWGRSMFRFPYQKVTRPPQSGVVATATYWQNDRGDFGHQEVIMRESGPGVYQIVYRPLYLCDPTPGHGEPRPFPGEQTSFAPWCGTTLGYGTNPPFRSIPAVVHHFACECREGLDTELTSFLSDRGIDLQSPILPAGKRTAGNSCIAAYERCAQAWNEAFQCQDARARAAIDWLLVHPKNRQLVDRPEPNGWHSEVGRAIQHFMITYAMLSLGREGFESPDLRPAPMSARHATAGEQLSITFLWGAGTIPAPALFTAFQKALYQQSVTGMFRSHWLLVFVHPHGWRRDEVVQGLQQLSASVIEAPTPPGAGAHLAGDGEVTSIPDPILYALSDSELSHAFTNADDFDVVTQRLVAVVRNAMAP